ncbi:MAG: AAA family ATPase, partial [Candidatus Symbiothrix sp.]|nr:AAA family ATPase [Candidatus Symbiothrix sp.]
MNFWHMQLHPNNHSMDKKEILRYVKELGVIGMGERWENDKGQPTLFRNDVNVGDIVLIRHQGPLCLVEVLGNCEENDNDIDVWFKIYRKVKFLSDKIPSFHGDWKKGIFTSITIGSANRMPFIKHWYQIIKKKQDMKNYVDLLKENNNLILTGAPGTGKTYLAKQIAKQVIGVETDEELEQSEQFAFVQFHPSYDYTDFVEGLRPTKPD